MGNFVLFPDQITNMIRGNPPRFCPKQNYYMFWVNDAADVMVMERWWLEEGGEGIHKWGGVTTPRVQEQWRSGPTARQNSIDVLEKLSITMNSRYSKWASFFCCNDNGHDLVTTKIKQISTNRIIKLLLVRCWIPLLGNMNDF